MTNILSPRFGSLFYLFRIVLFFKYFYSISLTLSYFSRVNDNSWLFLVMPCRSRIKCKLFSKSQLLFLTLEDNINAPFCGYWEFKGCKLVTSGFLGGPWVSLNYLKLQPLCTQVTLSILLIYIPLLKMPFVLLSHIEVLLIFQNPNQISSLHFLQWILLYLKQNPSAYPSMLHLLSIKHRESLSICNCNFLRV